MNWLKCAETLPEMRMRCIVSVGGKVCIGYRMPVRTGWYWMVDDFLNPKRKQKEIEHWMQIPQAPEKAA